MKKLILFLLLLFVFLSLPGKVQAANFYLEPSTSTVQVGSEFEVAVWIDPGGEDIQAMDIFINYDATRLQTSQEQIKDEQYFGSYGSSVFNVSDPPGKLSLYVFSNQGTYSRNTEGKVVTITFKAKVTGTASVNFICGGESGSAIWDSAVTNLIVCGANGSGSYTLIESGTTPTLTPTEIEPTVEETATSTALPETGFSPFGWGAVLLGGILISTSLLILLF